MKITKAKTIAAAVGATLTAATTALATVQLVLDDGALDLTEYGTVATAVMTLCVSVYAVWRVPNKPVT